jgi:hypothetical protein
MNKFIILIVFIFLSNYIIGQHNKHLAQISNYSQRTKNNRDWPDAANQADTIFFFSKETSNQEFSAYGKAFNITYHPGGYLDWTLMEINGSGNFELYSKSTCEINQSNGLVAFVYDSLRIGNVWIPSRKQELIYTNFDSLLYDNSYEYDLQNGWQQTRRINYLYNDFNRCYESVELLFTQGFGLVPYLRKIHQYDDNNRRISTELELYNMSSSEYSDLSLDLFAYEYAQPQYLDSISQRLSHNYNYYLGIYAPSFSRQFFRNSQGKVESTSIDRWIEGSFPIEFEPEGQEVYEYNSNGDVIIEKQKKVIDGIYYDYYKSESLDYSIGEQLNFSKTFYYYDSSSFIGSGFDLTYADSIVFKSYPTSTILKTINANDFLTYPNPGNGIIHIVNYAEQFEYADVLTVDGRTLKSIEITPSIDFINIKELTKGIYFLRLSNRNKLTSTIKYIKNE